MDIMFDTVTFAIANIYGPSNDDLNLIQNFLAELCNFSIYDIIIGGDFNAVLNNALDKAYGEPHNK